MNDDLMDLYQELILDHNRRPRNRRRLQAPSGEAEGFNPLCGDRVSVFVDVEDDMVKDVSFEGSGCAISTASASLMTEMLKGKTVTEAKELFDTFHGMVTGDPTKLDDDRSLGKLEAFSRISRFPARVKCAILVWHTLKAALEQNQEMVTTE